MVQPQRQNTDVAELQVGPADFGARGLARVLVDDVGRGRVSEQKQHRAKRAPNSNNFSR